MYNSTIEYYNLNAKKYFDLTVGANMLVQYNLFLNKLPLNSKILDFGCGSGRDTKYFLDKGYIVDAIDGSLNLCKLASIYTGIDVKCMDFNDLSIYNYYDGVWACASLLHLNNNELNSVLLKIYNSLKNNGVFYSSFKDGNSLEVVDKRLYNYLSIDNYINIISKIGFNVLDVLQTKTVLNNNEKRLWNNFVLVKKL